VTKFISVFYVMQPYLRFRNTCIMHSVFDSCSVCVIWYAYEKNCYHNLNTILALCTGRTSILYVFSGIVIYEGVSKSFRTDSITIYTLTFGITR
jgi:hypothetical protein